MPFAAQTVLDDQNEAEKKNVGMGVNISGQSSSFATNVPGQDGAPTGSAQKSSGQYANIQSYLDANKQQADEMGQKISTDVSSKADDATQKIQGFESQAPKVEAYDPNAVLGDVTKASDQQKAAYKVQKQTGGYTGPQTVDQAQGYGDTIKVGQEAVQDVKNAGNEIGQQQLLKKAYERPQYSAGENRLDQVLLQNSAGSKANLEGLSQKYSGLGNYLNTTTQNVGNAINQANSQALANKNAFQPAEQATKNNLLNPIQARADQANMDNQGLIDRVSADAQDDMLSEETMRTLGLSEGQNIYDLNIGSYLNPDRTQVGLNNAANADERNKYAQLSQLFDDPSMSQITADGKAINAAGLNKEKFDADVGSKKAEYERQYSTEAQGFMKSGPGTIARVSTLVAKATPKEVEDVYIPHYQNLYRDFVNTYGEHDRRTQKAMSFIQDMQKQVQDFKDTFKINRTIKKG